MNLKSAQTAKVGKIFKDARLLKSLSLSEASTETVINVEYIIAIESGDYSVFLPGLTRLNILKNMQTFFVLVLDFLIFIMQMLLQKQNKKKN